MIKYAIGIDPHENGAIVGILQSGIEPPALDFSISIKQVFSPATRDIGALDLANRLDRCGFFAPVNAAIIKLMVGDDISSYVYGWLFGFFSAFSINLRPANFRPKMFKDVSAGSTGSTGRDIATMLALSLL